MKNPPLEAARWFRQAELDIDAARVLRAGQLPAAACFHAQQAAEKALKAVLYSQGERVVLGHSVADLAARCSPHEAAFAVLVADGRLLDQFYIPTRYPNGLPAPAVPGESYTDAQAQAALVAAERVLEVVQAFLAQSLKPQTESKPRMNTDEHG